MTPTKELLSEALKFADSLGDKPGWMATYGEQFVALASAYRAKCAEVEELRKALEEAKDAMEERRLYCNMWEYKYGKRWDKEDAAVNQALEGKE